MATTATTTTTTSTAVVVVVVATATRGRRKTRRTDARVDRRADKEKNEDDDDDDEAGLSGGPFSLTPRTQLSPLPFSPSPFQACRAAKARPICAACSRVRNAQMDGPTDRRRCKQINRDTNKTDWQKRQKSVCGTTGRSDMPEDEATDRHFP